MEAKHGVEAELAGNDHGERNRSFVVCVGEPSVEREDGHLDCEGEEKCESYPEERAGGKNAAGGLVLQFAEVESVSAHVEPQDGDQQRRGRDEGEEEEFER